MLAAKLLSCADMAKSGSESISRQLSEALLAVRQNA